MGEICGKLTQMRNVLEIDSDAKCAKIDSGDKCVEIYSDEKHVSSKLKLEQINFT